MQLIELIVRYLNIPEPIKKARDSPTNSISFATSLKIINM